MEIEKNVKISTHNGSQVARQHNLRNPKVITKEDHIDPNGHFEVWLDEDPKITLLYIIILCIIQVLIYQMIVANSNSLAWVQMR